VKLPLVHVNHPNLSSLLGGGTALQRVRASRPGVGLVVLREPGKSTVIAAGTCTLISPDIVLTAGHVISFAQQYMATKFTGADANNDRLLQVRFNVAFTAATATKKRHNTPDADLEKRQPRYDVVKVEDIRDNTSTTGTDEFALVRIARLGTESDGVFPQPIQTDKIDAPAPPDQKDEQPTSNLEYAVTHFGSSMLSLQHPGGEPMQATIGPTVLLNQAKDDNSDLGPLHYLDILSERGSSGGPIFDDGGSTGAARGPDLMVAILLGSSPKKRGTLTRVMPLDRVFRQSALFRSILGR
jgi:Trypsin-like peptidase domain